MTTCAVILAGGQANRMGGGDKGRLMLGEQSLIERVIERISPQVDAVVLNANGDPSRFDDLGLPVVADSIPDYPGPLAGVLAGMDWAAEQGHDWLISVAADTPSFPLDLAERLAAIWADQRPDGCYPVPRAESHAWFRLAGKDPAAVLARLASVDFRPVGFDDLAIAQTFVARVAAVVVRDGDAYDILADSASALYLWDCILEALGENP